MFETNSLFRSALAVALGAALWGAAGAAHAQSAIPEKPEAGSFKMGVEPWLGYGQWHVAAQKGLFAKQGLSDVEVINFNEDKDINAALASGQLDAANIATHTAIGMIEAGLPVKAVMLLDFSLKADAIVSASSVTSIKDLKGQSVAFEEGTTSDILLNYALAQNGMSIDDIKRVPMPASDAGGALIAGRVPVAVTYEPYISAAMAQDKNVKLLYTAGENPGLISDVFVVRDEVLKSRPGQVLAMLKSWDAALADYRANTQEDRKIIAEAVGAAPDELNTAFDGVQYYSVPEAAKAFTGEFASKTFKNVLAAAKQAQLVTGDIAFDAVVDPTFAAAATK